MAGRFSRYATADIDALAADHDLGEQVVWAWLSRRACSQLAAVTHHLSPGTSPGTSTAASGYRGR
jgi:hypothetical protein